MRDNFRLIGDERSKLEELVTVLEKFEFWTNELQSSQVSISKVYPCFRSLKTILSENGFFQFTQTIRDGQLKSLNLRFDIYFVDPLFTLSTFLDPNYGIRGFEKEKHNQVLGLVKDSVSLSNQSVSSVHINQWKF